MNAMPLALPILLVATVVMTLVPWLARGKVRRSWLMSDLVAHYDQMAAEVAHWPVAPATIRRTFPSPTGPVDYFYALRPPGVPIDTYIPLRSPDPTYDSANPPLAADQQRSK